MKKRFKIILGAILIFIPTLVATFICLFPFFGIFNKFEMITDSVCLWLTFIVSIIVSFMVTTYIFTVIITNKKRKFYIWISQNLHKILLYIIMFSLFCTSIRTEVILVLSEQRNLISLCWNIFGVSITIFLVWQVIVLKYLKDNRPNSPKSKNLILKSWHIDDKRDFYNIANNLFDSIIILTINLVVLIIATGSVYVVSTKFPLLTQTFVILSFYFCTNTIFQLFIDIISILNSEKKPIVEDMKTTYDDLKFQIELDEKVEKAQSFFKTLEGLNGVSDDLKEKIKTEILKEFLGGSSVNTQEELCEVNQNDQL